MLTVFVILLLILLILTNKAAIYFKAKRPSSSLIIIVWLVGAMSTLPLINLINTSFFTYILFFVLITFICFKVLLGLKLHSSMLLAIGNFPVIYIVMHSLGLMMVPVVKAEVLVSIEQTTREICDCNGDVDCLTNTSPQVLQLITQSKLLYGKDASLSADVIAEANKCLLPATKQKNVMIATLLDNWEHLLKINSKKERKDMSDQPIQTSLNHQTKGISKQSTESHSAKSQKNMSGEKPVTLEKERVVSKKLLRDFKNISVHSVKKHLNDQIRLTRKSGSKLEGWLKTDENNKITITQKLSGGYVLMPISKNSIRLLESKPRKTIADRTVSSLKLTSSYHQNIRTTVIKTPQNVRQPYIKIKQQQPPVLNRD